LGKFLYPRQDHPADRLFPPSFVGGAADRSANGFGKASLVLAARSGNGVERGRGRVGKHIRHLLAIAVESGEALNRDLWPGGEIIAAVEKGRFHGQAVDAGLIIHEGQLTYTDRRLKPVVDLGKWWLGETGLPLPLGANVIRKDLGREVILDVNRLLKQSIDYGLDHRDEALEYALRFGRDLDRERADRFVGMYVNDWTLDFRPRGREAVRMLLDWGHKANVIPTHVTPEFVEDSL